MASEVDLVNHPPHYSSHPSGVECITVTEHMGFNLGNAVKYIWRADEKGSALEDLRKAAWYVNREIERRAQSGRSTEGPWPERVGTHTHATMVGAVQTGPAIAEHSGELIHGKNLTDDRFCSATEGLATVFAQIVTCPDCREAMLEQGNAARGITR